jgi:predicted nucleic acid-binding protein
MRVVLDTNVFVSAVTDYLLKTAEFVTPAETLAVIEADPSDNKFLEAALAGDVRCIVSGDSHLLELKSFRGVDILTTRDFISVLDVE